MGTIKQATYGNETSSTDVTDSLVNMFRSGKGFLELEVGPGIVKQREVGEKVELNDDEKSEIKRQAEQSCGNALDAECIRTTSESLRSSKLSEKARVASSQTVVGERLTVTVVGLDGKEKTLVIPKDNVFRFGRAPPGAPSTEMQKAYREAAEIFTVGKLIQVSASAFFYFVWVFGTAFAWLALGQSYTLPNGQSIDPSEYWWLRYLGAGSAVLTAGYGGFIVVILAFFVLGLKHFIVQRSLLMSKQ